MKKLLFILFGILLTMPVFAADGEQFMYSYEGQTLTYTVISEADKTVRTREGALNTSGNQVSGNSILPEKVQYNGSEYTLTEIGDYAFYGCSGLTSIEIPNSVTSIGRCAFQKCTKLTSIEIPNSVTSIGIGAFQDCTGLTSVEIPNSVTSIGGSAFRGCSGLTSLTIGDSVTSIGDWAFRECTGLTSLTIGDSVTSIGDWAFYRCTKLTSLTIPNSVTTIGSSSFQDCTGLTSLTIGNSVTSIGNSAFQNCYYLTSVDIPNSVTSIGVSAFYYCYNLTSLTIGNSVISIGDRAFQDCYYLKSVDIPNSVTEIGSDAFKGSRIETLSIDVQNIPNWFSGISTLKNLTIGNSVTSIGSSAFSYCSGLTSVTIGNSVTSIGDMAFYKCERLSSIQFGNSVTSIGAYAFGNCTGLTSMVIPKSVNSIGNSAFYQCTKLNKLIFADCEEPIKLGYDNYGNSYGTERGLFYYCPLEYLYVGRDISYSDGQDSGYSPFYNIKTLTNIEFGNLVTTISSRAFSGCSGLTSVVIPNQIQTICDYAFDGCSLNLVTSKALTAPIIGESTFNGSYETAALQIPDGAFGSYIDPYNFWYKFPTLNASINAGTNLTADFELVGISYRKVGAPEDYQVEVVRSDSYSELTDVVIPESVLIYEAMSGEEPDDEFGGDAKGVEMYTVVGIAPNAFSGFDNIVSVTTPTTMHYIADMAFRNCENMASLNLNDGLVTIGVAAFQGCKKGLTKVVIPNTVTSIGGSAFQNCNKLTDLTLSESLTEISAATFGDCWDLLEVVIPESVKKIGSSAFRDIDLVTITISDNLESIDAYAFKGDMFLEAVEFTENSQLKKIGDYAFDGAARIKSLRLPDSLESIGQYAFNEARMLSSLEIPANENLVINNHAFYSCQGIKEISFRGKVKNIGDYAFANNTSLISASVAAENLNEYILASNDKLEIVNVAGNGKLSATTFNGSTALTDVSLDVTDIDAKILYQQPNLKTVKFGDNVRNIGSYAVSECANLEEAVFGANIDILDTYAFQNDTNLKSVDLSGVKNIGGYCFYGCTGLTEVTFGTKLEIIDSYAFSNTDITKLEFPYAEKPEPVIEVREKAFVNDIRNKTENNNITEIHLGNRTKSIAQNNFPGKLYDVVDLGTTVQVIEDRVPVAKGTTVIPGSLKEIKLPLTTNNSMASEKCDSIYIAYGEIPASIIFDCRHYQDRNTIATAFNVKNLIIDREIASIVINNTAGNGASNYYDYFNVENIVFTDNRHIRTNLRSTFFQMIYDTPQTVYVGSSIASMVSPRAVKIEFNEGIQELSNISGIENTSLKLPSSLRSLKFSNNKNLEKLVFADSDSPLTLSVVGSNLSYSAESLSQLYIGRNIELANDFNFGTNFPSLKEVVLGNNEANTVTKISDGLFQGNTSLEYCLMAESIKEIGKDAFRGCSNLKIWVMPASLESIGSNAYTGCSSLKRIVARTATPVDGDVIFEPGIEENVPLYVPEGSERDYRRASRYTLFYDYDNIISHKGNVAESVVLEEVEDLDDAKPGDEIDMMMLANPQRVLVGAEPRSAAPRRAKAADDVFDSFYWFSPNPEIATITEDGILTVHKDEPAEIWCYALDGSDQKAVIGLNQFILGDLNADKKINTADLEMMIGHILAPAGSTVKLKAADLNGDGIINTADIEIMINTITNQ